MPYALVDPCLGQDHVDPRVGNAGEFRAYQKALGYQAHAKALVFAQNHCRAEILLYQAVPAPQIVPKCSFVAGRAENQFAANFKAREYE